MYPNFLLYKAWTDSLEIKFKKIQNLLCISIVKVEVDELFVLKNIFKLKSLWILTISSPSVFDIT